MTGSALLRAAAVAATLLTGSAFAQAPAPQPKTTALQKAPPPPPKAMPGAQARTVTTTTTTTTRPGPSATAAMPSGEKIEAALQRAHRQFLGEKEGKNADYIPWLAKVPPQLFGIAIVTVDGKIYQVGDSQHLFPIQSVSKPFTLARLMEQRGAQMVEDKIGVDATGQPFNSIIAIESNENHRAGNPLVNAGAITTVSMLEAKTPEDRWNVVNSNLGAFAGRALPLNAEVYKSETDTNTRNQSITKLLESYEVLGSPPEQALDIYTRQCSVDLNTKDLAVMGATLANGGKNPVTGQQVVAPGTAKRVLSLMATNGLYETTGEWTYRVGLPAKSGVGGGIVAVVPGRFAIAAFSPPLDKAGNSVRAQKAIEAVVNDLNANLYSSIPASAESGTGGSPRP